MFALCFRALPYAWYHMCEVGTQMTGPLPLHVKLLITPSLARARRHLPHAACSPNPVPP